MRIHTNLNTQQMYEVIKASGAPIYPEILERHGSRTHDQAFEVALSGTGGHPNSGGYGASSEYQAATWDEWGAFLGALYAADANARCGGSVKYPIYRNAEHFHFSTGNRFQIEMKLSPEGQIWNHLPANTHPRHRWEYRSQAGFACTKCTATRPSRDQLDAYAPRAYQS